MNLERRFILSVFVNLNIHKGLILCIYCVYDAIKGTIQVKSRAGTGSASSSSPASIMFGFAPSIIIPIDYYSNYHGGYIYLNLSNDQPILRTDQLTTSYDKRGWGETSYNNYSVYVKKSSDGKTIYWYPNTSDYNYFNYSGYTYYFIGMS